jgi:hypothetical protein
MSSEAAPRIVVTAGKVFWALPFIRKDEVRKLAGVLAGLVVLQKSAGGVWWWSLRAALPKWWACPS